MIEDDFLDTFEYDLNHDDLLFFDLLNEAEFYWHEGVFKSVQEAAEMFFEMHREAGFGEGVHLRDLRRAYNAFLEVKQIADFEDEMSEETLSLWHDRESALVKELLGFYRDREMFVILEVKDTVYKQSAWLLMYKDVLEELGVRVKRGEA